MSKLFENIMSFLRKISYTSSFLTKEELESILNCMSEGLIIYNMNLDPVFINPSLAQMLIPRNPAATGRLIVNPDDKILFERCVNIAKIKEIQEALKKEPALPRSDIIELKNPKQILKRYSSPLYDKKEIQSGHVIIYHDITTEAENEHLRTEFIATASHELRTPVTTIKVLLESLIEGAKDEPELKDEFLTDLTTEVERLEQLVNNLLDITRYEAGEEKLNPAKLKLTKVIKDAFNTIIPLAKQRNINVIADFRKLTSFGMILADKLRLHQILVNLLTNSVKFTPAGGEVRVDVQKKQGLIEFKVSDTGIGIPQDALPHIFDKFFRIGNGRDSSLRGSGLGLTIVKHAVSIHGGEIYIQSRPGQTTVTFTIPEGK